MTLIFFSFICHQHYPQKIVHVSVKRDTEGFHLDPLGEGQIVAAVAMKAEVAMQKEVAAVQMGTMEVGSMIVTESTGLTTCRRIAR